MDIHKIMGCIMGCKIDLLLICLFFAKKNIFFLTNCVTVFTMFIHSWLDFMNEDHEGGKPSMLVTEQFTVTALK